MLVGIGMVGVCLGIIALLYGVMQKMKAGRVADAPLASTGDVSRRGREVAGPKGQISAQGNVVCQQPLIAPFSGQPCLYYRIKCTAKWKDGDRHKEKVLDDTKMAAQFAIDDGSGPVWIDAREGGDFEPSQRKSETKGTGLIGGITGTDLVFGSYRVNTPMLDLGTKYEVEEDIMPVVPRMYACGKLADQGGAIGAPGWRQLILSAKSRDELLAAATKTAKMALIGGAASFVVGSGMAAVGQFVLSHDEPEAAAAAATADPASKASPPAGVAATTTATSTATAPADTATAGTTKTTGAITPKAGAAVKPTTTATAAKSGATATASASASASAKPAASAPAKK
jgi:hypothetical protein